jgi:hypothetical protein
MKARNWIILAVPLRMVDQDMKRRPLDGNARSLEPDTQLSENIVNEALIARAVCQPVRNVAVRMRGDGIDVWRRVHILLLSSDLDRRYRIYRVPARRRQRRPPQLATLIKVNVPCDLTRAVCGPMRKANMLVSNAFDHLEPLAPEHRIRLVSSKPCEVSGVRVPPVLQRAVAPAGDTNVG